MPDDPALFYPVADPASLAVAVPPPRHGLSLRTVARTVTGMQKEALVASSASDAMWHLASDEGPYLQGTDLAPPPLGHFCAGMVAAHANEILRLAAERGLGLEGLRLEQETFYTMDGSALRGTMTGSALPPELAVGAECELGADELTALVLEAVDRSPVTGLVRGIHESLFTLIHNGDRIETGRVHELAGPLPSAPDGPFARATAAPAGEPLLLRVREAEHVEGEGGAGSSLQAEQKRMLHVRAVCTVREDGVKEIDQFLFKPVGSQFRMLSAEDGRAPDACSLLTAGLAFCFMTQLGRYATITKRPLHAYGVVQDTHFSAAGGSADAVETHVFLDTSEDGDSARQMLDMGEQTCFLHALCRTDLEPLVRLSGDA